MTGIIKQLNADVEYEWSTVWSIHAAMQNAYSIMYFEEFAMIFILLYKFESKSTVLHIFHGGPEVQNTVGNQKTQHDFNLLLQAACFILKTRAFFSHSGTVQSVCTWQNMN